MSRRTLNPHPYQVLIRDHILEHDRCAVWAGMGMGKGSSTLLALDILQTVDTGKVLVLGPLRVARDVWPNEVRKWEQFRSLEVVPIVGTERERTAAIKFDAPIYSTNYESLPWLADHFGARWPFATVVADESTKLKSFRLRQGGKRAAALRGLAHTKIKRFVELTGTPSPNGLRDLWGQMWFLDRGERLGRTHDAFKQRWFRPKKDGYGDEPLPHAQAEIQELVRDLCITVDPADWFDLAKPIVRTVEVYLPAKARKHYDELEREMFTQLESGHEVEAFNGAAKSMKCLQAANGALYVDEGADWKEIHDEKLQALESVLNEADGPVLAAYHFKSDRARILAAFPDAIDVATPDGFRDAVKGKGRLWIGHPASMGHGVDGLQEHCHIVCFFGHAWNLEQRLQFVERIGPMRQAQAGKNRPVWIYNIVARDTVDELVIERIESKREVQDLLLAYMKGKRK